MTAVEPPKGLWRKMIGPDGLVNAVIWELANASGDVIGTCRVRQCGGYLAVDTPPDVFGLTDWFYARCLKCGQEVVSPKGRVLRRSGLKSERGIDGQ